MQEVKTTLSVKAPKKLLPARVLLIDNFDSFSFNLVQYLSLLTEERIKVCRADKIDFALLDWATHIVLSPGPGKPSDAAGSIEVLKQGAGRVPVLGVCLGFQVIVCEFGGSISPHSPPLHGKADWITHSEAGLFEEVPNPMQVGRYHSLACDKVPAELDTTARNKEGLVMAVQHKKKPIFGVQFHPESILTITGIRMLYNFLMQEGGKNLL